MSKLTHPFQRPTVLFLVRANEGRTLHAFGEVFVVLLDGKQTGEKFTAFSVSVHLAGGRGRTITNAKTNGSISSRAYGPHLVWRTHVNSLPTSSTKE